MATFNSAEDIFGQMKATVDEMGKSLVPKVKGIIKFDVKNVGSWTLDLKSGNGSVEKDSAKQPNLTISVAEPDFLLIASNKLNAQQAFMKGKIKVKGNMGLAMKLNTVLDATRKMALKKPASVSGGGSSSSSSSLKSALVFDLIGKAIAERGAEYVKKTKGIYQFNITPGGHWHLDLKNGSGALTQGTKKADITITVSDEDFFSMYEGKLNGQQAFMKGKLKIKGNMGLAMKLNTVMDAAKPKSKL